MQNSNPSDPSQIREAAGNLLKTTFSDFRQQLPDLKWIIRPQEDQNDIGVDFECELRDKINDSTIFLFKIQNKGVDASLNVLTSTENRGLIQFSISVKHAKYYRYQLSVPLVYTVCELEKSRVFWHPVQKDDELDRRIVQAEKENRESLSFYINPANVICLNTLERFIEDLKDSLAIQRIRARSWGQHHLFGGKYAVVVDRATPIVDQVYSYLTTCFKEISFLPVKIFASYYPFRTTNAPMTLKRNFTLMTDNEELFGFFKSCAVINGKIAVSKPEYLAGVADTDAKISAIFRLLNQNHIYSIGKDKSAEEVSIIFNSTVVFNALNELNIFSFSGVTEFLANPPTNLAEMIEAGYVYYKLGNYKMAAVNFINANREAELQSKHLTSFIAKYNLSKLSRYVNIEQGASPSDKEIAFRLEAVDLDVTAEVISEKVNPEIVSWIKNQSFITEARGNVYKTAFQILDMYENNTWGSFSYNNIIGDLFRYYSELEDFLNQNGICYDSFTEYEEVTDIFIEGCFASYAMRPEQESRLKYFDDWLSQRILLYGSYKLLTKLVGKYKIHDIVYKRSSDDPDNFLCYIDKILALDEGSFVMIAGKYAGAESYLGHQYNQYFQNALVLYAIYKLDENEYETVAKKILHRLNTTPILYLDSFKAVSLFLTKKGRFLTSGTLEDFLLLSLTSQKMQNWQLDKTICDVIVEKHNVLTPDKGNNFDFNENFLSEITLGDKVSLVYLYQIASSPTAKELIREKVQLLLRQDFDADLFYYAAIYEMLPVMPYLDQFTAFCRPKEKEGSVMQIVSGKSHKRFSRFNMLINLSLKYKLDLTSPMFESFRNIDPYYDWLMDMEGFDYTKFNPFWVTEKLTLYYKEKIRTSVQTKKHLENHLREHVDHLIHRVYFFIYSVD